MVTSPLSLDRSVMNATGFLACFAIHVKTSAGSGIGDSSIVSIHVSYSGEGNMFDDQKLTVQGWDSSLL